MKEQIIYDLEKRYAGIYTPDQLSDAKKAIRGFDKKYPATGNIEGGIVYARLNVEVKGGQKCGSDVWGAFTPGAGALIGDIYTSDIDTLYRDTVSCEVNATPLYVNVNFINAKTQIIGSFQAGGISTIVGVGAGKCIWGANQR